MLPGPALRGPGPAGGVGGPGAAAFRPMGPAGPAAQYQVSRVDGRAGGRPREHARGCGRWGASSEGPGAAVLTQGTVAQRAECAGHGGGQGRVAGQLAERVRATVGWREALEAFLEQGF